MKKMKDLVPVIAIFAISLFLIVISSAILGADEIAEIFNAPFLSVNATQILVALDLIGVFDALICTLLCFEKSKKEKQSKVADKNDPCKEFERMGNLKKIKIRYAGRIVDAFLLGIYTREHYQFQKTFLEYLFFRKTKSKITTIKQNTYLVFLPWKHQAKQLEEVTEADIVPFEKTFPPEWISIPEYTSIGTDEYCPPMAIQDFRGYSFLFQNNSFIADQVSHEYETNLEILYSEMPELLGEEFDEDIF